AKELMESLGASFIVTGEVLGQRPMSQNIRAMKIIEKEAGVEGYVLRPLSAKLLEPTIPEKMGWVDRESLFAIKGRSRKVQIALAHKLGIYEFPNAAGGCLLTDPIFSKRLKDLLTHTPNPTLNDIELLKVGRHFRLSPQAKLVVGRDKLENQKILLLKLPSDFILKVNEFVGPISLVRGELNDDLLNLAASITVRYSDAPKDRPVLVDVKKEERSWELRVTSIDEERIKPYRI
ncbi:MAG: tRNA (5-methylaminomethyl-2-thiouridylate)-methyltransferase, partial [Nitrososphaerales archaeon]|nr:tRNA (5-methylaminomethyl-2-thiouridylate)-methyltransferase [Nitrososphaerales archaeon]